MDYNETLADLVSAILPPGSDENMSFDREPEAQTDGPSRGILLNYSLTNTILVGVGLFIVIIVTALGNFLVGFSLFRFRSLRTISNYLIGNLALSDFLLAITILPLSTVNECLGHWVFGRVACNLWLITDVLYCTASIWNICVIAFDRFTATFYPMWYRDKRSAKQAALYVGLVWLISAAVCVPPLLGWNDITQNYKHNNETGFDDCMIFQKRSYVLYSASGSFFVPFFITVGLYVRIFGVLRQRMRRSASVRSSRRRTLVQSSVKAVEDAPAAAEKTPLCKTLTLETTVYDSPLRTSLSQSMDEGRDAKPDIYDEKSSSQQQKTSGLCVKLYGSQNRPVTETIPGGRSTSNGRRYGRFISRLDPDPDAQQCEASQEPSTPAKVSSSDGKAHLLSCEVDGAVISDDGSSIEVPVNGCCDVTHHEHTRQNSRADSDVTQCDDVTPRHLSTDDDAMTSHSRNNSIDCDVRSFVRRSDSSSPGRRHPRVKRGAPGSGASGGGGGGGGIGGGAGRISSDRGKPRLVRKASVVNAFRSIGSIRSLRESWTSHQQNFEQMEMKATVRMACIIAAFCCMWLGFFTIYVINSWCDVCSVPRELDAFFFWLGYLNSTVNPILYAIFNEEFRKAFKKILGFDNRRRRKASASSLGSSKRSFTNNESTGPKRRL